MEVLATPTYCICPQCHSDRIVLMVPTQWLPARSMGFRFGCVDGHRWSIRYTYNGMQILCEVVPEEA